MTDAHVTQRLLQSHSSDPSVGPPRKGPLCLTLAVPATVSLVLRVDRSFVDAHSLLSVPSFYSV